MRIAARVPGRGDTDHELLWTAMALASAAVGWVILRHPAAFPLPPCAFKALTGWPCLTCGATRALEALLALDVAGAWRLNPLVTSVAAAWGAYALYGGGALLGAWPRLSIRLGVRECTALRMSAAIAAAVAWAFLVADGR